MLCAMLNENSSTNSHIIDEIYHPYLLSMEDEGHWKVQCMKKISTEMPFVVDLEF